MGSNNNSKKDNEEKTWKELLDNYYELFKVIHFPANIDFEDHQIDWSDLKILLPDQELSRSKKIFAKIYEMPICQILILEKNHDRRQKINRLKHKIQYRLDESNDNHDNHEPRKTVLEIINQQSKQFINKIPIDRDEKDKLKNYFEHFEIIDKILYPYEYLSDINTKNTIDLVRISPTDAQLGFGKSQNVYTKLRGYKLNAFGGFFKKAWRSNDILWGRLDGLDRLVDALVTPKSLKNFLQFCKKYQGNSKLEDYLESLVQDSLPQATDEELEVIINYLQCISPHSTCESPHSQEEFEKFLDCLVKAGQRQILSEDLDGVIEDIEKSKSKSSPESLESEQSKQSSNKILINPQYLEEKFQADQAKKSELNFNRVQFWKIKNIRIAIKIVIRIGSIILSSIRGRYKIDTNSH